MHDMSSFPVSTEEQFCGGRLTKSQGSVKTPNWPNSNYPTGISCSWHISVEPSNVSQLNFCFYREFIVLLDLLDLMLRGEGGMKIVVKGPITWKRTSGP